MPESAAPLWLHEAVVRPDWVDYNGHMSEAYYVLVFGDATDAFYDHVGMDDAFRRVENISVYTLEAHIRYLIEAHEGQAVRIATRVLSHDAKRLRLHHTMVDEGGQVLAVTELAALHVDKAGPRACPFRAEPLARIAAIAAAQAGLGAPEPAVTRHWQVRPGALPLDPAGDKSPDPNFAAQLSGGLGPSAPAGVQGAEPPGLGLL